MDIHQRISAWMHIASAVLALLMIAFCAAFFAAIAIFFEIPQEVQVIAAAFGSLVAFFFSAFALIELLGGIGCLSGWAAGRPLIYIANALQLLNIPFGTALALYTFWAYLREPAPGLTIVQARG